VGAPASSDVIVAITPSTLALAPGAARPFTATVSGTPNLAVTWTCTGGTITQAGLYKAPATAGMCTVKATSKADPTRSAAARPRKEGCRSRLRRAPGHPEPGSQGAR